MADLFEKFSKNKGSLGQYQDKAHGYFAFPRLEGDISNRMIFQGKERVIWSLNNYLGLANHPEVRKADADALVNTLLDDLVCVVEHVDVDVSLRTFIGDNKK